MVRIRAIHILALSLLLLIPTVSAASPDYAIGLIESSVKVIHGETAGVVVKINFLDGFTTTGITLQVTEAPPGSASFTPASLTREGGSLLRINTGGIAPGVYNWRVRSSAPGYVAKFVPFTLNVTTTGELEFYTLDASHIKTVVTSLSPTAQGVTNVYVGGRDSNGYQFQAGTPITLTSASPATAAVYPHEDGYNRVYAVASGSTTLTATAPDGYTAGLPVSVALPSDPRITSIGVTPATVTNKGDEMVVFTATATSPLEAVSYDCLPLVNGTSYWYDGDKSFIGTGYVQEGLAPGDYSYFFRAEAGSGCTAVRALPLKVVNDPSKGEIRGAVYPLTPDPDVAATGQVRMYDSVGSLVATRDADTTFAISYVAPGTYRLRFVPSDQDALEPQWWPNASDFASASDVVVAAGGVAEGIFFFPAPPDGPRPPSVVSTTPADGEVGVDGASPVTVTFSKTMNTSTLNSNTFRVLDHAGVPIPGAVTCANGITARFDPTTALVPGADYSAEVTTGAADTGGLPLEEAYAWGFSTAADADTLSESKALNDGVSVALSGKFVHLKCADFAYIEELSRASGMRIEGAIAGALDGSIVSLKGVMATTPGGERYIDVLSLSVTGASEVGPLGAMIRGLESSILDGLCVRVWGRVSGQPLYDSFILSDGSCGQGVPVITPAPHGLADGALVSVTGAAGWEGIRMIHAEMVIEQ